jgi:hypothetical protein
MILRRFEAVSANGTALAMLKTDRTRLSQFETGSAMRLGAIGRTGSQRDGFTPRAAKPTTAAAVEGRALVARAPPPHQYEVPSGHRQAAFLAQLIATKDQHPQTRARRRAEPGEAIAAYRAAAALVRWS